MELISSVDAEVSSSEAACSEDPCANDWLEEETCEAALATCWAPSPSSQDISRSCVLIRRTTNNATEPMESERAINAMVNHRLCSTAASALFDVAARTSSTFLPSSSVVLS